MFQIKNFTDNNDIKTLDTLGAFTIIEYLRDLSVMPGDIEGWTNSALKGTRAWWGFSFLDYDSESPNEKVAKVTPYDSKMVDTKGGE